MQRTRGCCDSNHASRRHRIHAKSIPQPGFPPLPRVSASTFVRENPRRMSLQYPLGRAGLALLAVVAVFILILRINLWVPMHGDDYFYYLKGISLQGTLAHYENWSGRVVADFISSAILRLQNPLISAFLNSLAFLGLIGSLWWLPRFGSRARGPYPVTAFLLLFATYWLANAALGETTFGLVGSANYLWTNLVQAVFLALFLRAAEPASHTSAWRTAALTALALAAGCTNENTSVTTLVLIGAYAWTTPKEPGFERGKLWLYVAAFAVGTLILLLSPGNAKRMVHYAEWTSLSLGEQLHWHFTHRFPTALARLWPALAVLLLLTAARPRLDHVSKRYVGLFLIAALVSLVAFAASPGMPRRSLNGTLMYLLASISFVLAASDASSAPARWARGTIMAALAACFAVSYTLIALSYRHLPAQAAVRDEIIRTGIARGDTAIEIPVFHYGRFLRPSSDQLDSPAHDGRAAQYFGTGARITSYHVTKNYVSAEEARRWRAAK